VQAEGTIKRSRRPREVRSEFAVQSGIRAAFARPDYIELFAWTIRRFTVAFLSLLLPWHTPRAQAHSHTKQQLVPEKPTRAHRLRPETPPRRRRHRRAEHRTQRPAGCRRRPHPGRRQAPVAQSHPMLLKLRWQQLGRRMLLCCLPPSLRRCVPQRSQLSLHDSKRDG
jgi:hypothetical protein